MMTILQNYNDLVVVLMCVCLLHSICQHIWKTQQWPQNWKRSIFIPIPKKGSAEECSNWSTVVLILPARKVMLKIWTENFQMYKLDLEKATDQRSDASLDHRKSKRIQKNIYFCFIDDANGFDCVDHNKLWKILRDGNTRPPDLPPEKPVCRLRSNSQNWTWNSRLVQNWEGSTSGCLLILFICRVHHGKC